jgi:hypothetical protein
MDPPVYDPAVHLQRVRYCGECGGTVADWSWARNVCRRCGDLVVRIVRFCGECGKPAENWSWENNDCPWCAGLIVRRLPTRSVNGTGQVPVPELDDDDDEGGGYADDVPDDPGDDMDWSHGNG